MTNDDVRSRLGVLEADMQEFRGEMKVAVKQLTDSTMAAIRSMESTVSQLQMQQVQQQAQSTSIPQLMQGAGMMLGIVTAISVFVIFTIDARTVDIRRDLQHVSYSQTQMTPEINARLAQLEARDASFDARLSGVAQQSEQHARWFSDRHKRANEYYERGQLGETNRPKPAAPSS